MFPRVTRTAFGETPCKRKSRSCRITWNGDAVMESARPVQHRSALVRQLARVGLGGQRSFRGAELCIARVDERGMRSRRLRLFGAGNVDDSNRPDWGSSEHDRKAGFRGRHCLFRRGAFRAAQSSQPFDRAPCDVIMKQSQSGFLPEPCLNCKPACTKRKGAR